MQNYVIVQKIELNEIADTVTRIQKKRDVVFVERDVLIIEWDETIQELNETTMMIRFLQNDLMKQQNQSSSIDRFIRSMKIHSFVVTSVFIALDALKTVKSAKLSDEKALADNNENEFENWLNEMKNKLQNSVDWYSIETNKIDYVRFQLTIDDDVVKHVWTRLRFDSDKFFQTIEEVL